MLDRLEESFDRISRFSADIAHDLRTPVNNIRGEAEVALARARTVDEYRDVIESCLEEAVRLSDLIGDLLFLARAESPLKHLQRAQVDVGELLGSIRDYYEASAAESGISLTTAVGAEPVIATLDRQLMQRAVGNLVANAMAHTLPGGIVVLAANADAAAIRIDVSDTGIGIPSECASKSPSTAFTAWTHPAPNPPAAPASDWQSSKASWSSTTAAPRSPANWATAPASRCTYHSPAQARTRKLRHLTQLLRIA